ncbi:glycosyltransferase family 57 protein [Sporormia fimetaria CBS 119925]|uniref:Glycosyltransferase family 57 protein n=1 Tax=Sporormia fimetaria CBS 119925 TaxID=1340428 RepID=A0A6A6VPL8_9PLEO|nr:glycosyltransferase family 57 protein [Sporormia fimetaria CBS 119925]
MSEFYPSIAQCAVVATALKVLLFPAYKSTDFEVHRNWLALTHSLPVKQWYYEQTSEWTLDYPPFFAYFEWLLSQAAQWIEPAMLNVKALNYDSWQTVYFQRTTVIVTELVLAYALHLYVKTSKSKTTAHAAALSILLSPGLLLIDHIHFQYNGFLLGILVLSLVLARSSSTLFLSGLLFATLLCFKHIYLYIAPAYFVYLLRVYCLSTRNAFPYFGIRLFNCIKLGLGIVSVFTVAFGPFVYWGQMEQLLRRLFPFSRGLSHAYWAPNVWALYSFTDRVLIYLAPHIGLNVDRNAVNSVTRGLIGDSSFAVLPDVAPLACFLLTLAAQIPSLIRLFLRPTWDHFVGAVTLCGYASFLFGWHVHEKAILNVIIPFSLIALKDRRYFGAFRPLAVAGYVSLFPLLFTAAEFPIKTVYTIFWLVLFLLSFDRLAPASPHPRVWLLDRFSLIYIALSIPLIAYCSLVHGLVFGDKLEFLPLMFTSSYAAIGVVGSWVGFLVVLYKRKPLKFEPLPPFLNDNTEVWVMEATDEVFTDYEKYLARRDFYMQKAFTCEATGRAKYTFFEAMDIEVVAPPHAGKVTADTGQVEASKEIDSSIPEVMRPRVLAFAQWRTTPRLDDLVNETFDHFREHYMVGERVSVEHDGRRQYGVIFDITDSSKAQNVFTGAPSEDQFRTSVYYITVENGGENIAKHKSADMQRDRSQYSKHILKQFLRSTVSRQNWYGAPWEVKEHLARRYRLDTVLTPIEKRKEVVAAAKKGASSAHAGQTKPTANANHQPNGNHAPVLVNGHAAPNTRPAHGPHTQTSFINYAGDPQSFRPDQNRPQLPPAYGPASTQHPPVYQYTGTYPPHYPPGYSPQLPPTIAYIAQQLPHGVNGLPIGLPFQPQFMQYQALPRQEVSKTPPAPTFPKLAEPIRYPTEDLKIPKPRMSVRPPLKFISDDVPEGVEPPETKLGISMESVGPLLCAWETLNVHDTVYSLDSFTFDDFVEAMRFSSDEVDCELLTEAHCAVLKQIIGDDGQILVALPQMDQPDESDDESEKSTSPEPEPEPPVRTTRSSLRKSEAQTLLKQHTPSPEPPKDVHSAPEFLEDYNWVEECKIRNFREGGWQAMLVGLLYRLSFDPLRKKACEDILAVLVPPDPEAALSAENVADNYRQMDVNLRIRALEMALLLTISTEAFREQLMAASTEMTRLRKEKIEHQRKRRELAEQLFTLDNERKIHLPANMPPSPTDSKATLDISMTATDDDKDDTEIADESEEEVSVANRKLRHTKQNKRKRVAEAAKKEKAKKAKVEAAKTKQQKEWEALLESIEAKKEELRECEANINETEDDLRETMVHRSRILGKDRFLNKYYWFEHNGMPFSGVPGSSTADYGYANGRVWVQGPDEHELQPNLEEAALAADREELGFTVPERKEKEEGDTHLSSSTDWGYYDDPEDLDKLLAWLDDRGLREKALKKELQLFRDRIATYMVKMKEHLADTETTKEEEEEDAPRISTRNKTYVGKDAAKNPCLKWTNSIMRAELGHNHSEEYAPKKKRGPKPGRGRGRK